MAFLERSDLSDNIYDEILNAITRNNNHIVEVAIDTAIAEARSYLNARYDTDAIFSATGNARNPIVLNFTKDIALYHIHSIHDPNTIPDIRVKRYDDAKNWFKAVNKLQINPDLPELASGDRLYIQYGSNPKRNNHY